MANFKKITLKEREQAIQYASFPFMQDMVVNFLNDFNRALEEKWEEKDFQNFKKGFEMLHIKLVQIMKEYNIQEIDPKGDVFDPHLHEVISVQNNSEYPTDTILQVCRKGYKLHDRLVQPAQVIVSGDNNQGANKESV